jgi:hypothetical protein
MRRLPVANREEELGFFAGMIAGTATERILLLEADGGMGKTTLMAEFVRKCQAAEVPCVPVDLKGDPGLHEVLARLCEGLGWEGFPTLTARVEELGPGGGGRAADAARFEHVRRERYNRAAIRDLMIEGYTVDGLQEFCFYRPAFEPALERFVKDATLQKLVMILIEFCQQRVILPELLVELRQERFELYKRHYARIYGIEAQARPEGETTRQAAASIGRSEIRDALRTADEGDRATRRGALTRALFDDLEERPERLVFLFDTCEQAGPEVGEWLAGTFLAHVHRAKKLVVVIAGRQVPEASLAWEAYCQHHRLGKLREPGLWQKYAERIGAVLPSPEFIPVFCQHFDGHPLKMMEALAPYVRGGGGQ